MPAPVKITFLGGLGEIGRNCACIEVDDRIMLIDCGLMFPDLDMLGIDLVLPDFSYLYDNADRVEGAILTPGHEDHTGGLRSEEHTSEIQSLMRSAEAVFCWKKKKEKQ